MLHSRPWAASVPGLSPVVEEGVPSDTHSASFLVTSLSHSLFSWTLPPDVLHLQEGAQNLCGVWTCPSRSSFTHSRAGPPGTEDHTFIRIQPEVPQHGEFWTWRHEEGQWEGCEWSPGEVPRARQCWRTACFWPTMSNLVWSYSILVLGIVGKERPKERVSGKESSGSHMAEGGLLSGKGSRRKYGEDGVCIAYLPGPCLQNTHACMHTRTHRSDPHFLCCHLFSLCPSKQTVLSEKEVMATTDRGI